MISYLWTYIYEAECVISNWFTGTDAKFPEHCENSLHTNEVRNGSNIASLMFISFKQFILSISNFIFIDYLIGTINVPENSSTEIYFRINLFIWGRWWHTILQISYSSWTYTATCWSKLKMDLYQEFSFTTDQKDRMDLKFQA